MFKKALHHRGHFCKVAAIDELSSLMSTMDSARAEARCSIGSRWFESDIYLSVYCCRSCFFATLCRGADRRICPRSKAASFSYLNRTIKCAESLFFQPLPRVLVLHHLTGRAADQRYDCRSSGIDGLPPASCKIGCSSSDDSRETM